MYNFHTNTHFKNLTKNFWNLQKKKHYIECVACPGQPSKYCQLHQERQVPVVLMKQTIFLICRNLNLVLRDIFFYFHFQIFDIDTFEKFWLTYKNINYWFWTKILFVNKHKLQHTHVKLQKQYVFPLFHSVTITNILP